MAAPELTRRHWMVCPQVPQPSPIRSARDPGCPAGVLVFGERSPFCDPRGEPCVWPGIKVFNALRNVWLAADPATEVTAEKIIELAQRGERDPLD